MFVCHCHYLLHVKIHHSFTQAHSYPSSPSPGPSLEGSQTQLSLGGEERSLEASTEERQRRKRVDEREEEEWGGALDTLTTLAEIKTASLSTLQR